jgi:glycosyltransferase involved in cell wall biosynthesis
MESNSFISIVMVVRNQEKYLLDFLWKAINLLESSARDYELILIDNGSFDNTVSIISEAIHEKNYQNLQVFILAKQVEEDTAICIGLENALGDFVVVIDSISDDLAFIPKMLEKTTEGFDIVFAKNTYQNNNSFLYRIASDFFSRFYKKIGGIDLTREAPPYRLLSRRIVNFILQHPRASIAYRSLLLSHGFRQILLTYKSAYTGPSKDKSISDGFNKGMQLIAVTTYLPIRFVSLLSLFGAICNFIYSIYVVTIASIGTGIAPGWASLSLQQSGMFFLISIVLFVLGEYILQMSKFINEGPQYYIAHEMMSNTTLHKDKLNIDELMKSSDKKILN